MKATFEADFSNFHQEVETAVLEMQSLETEATKVGPAVSGAVVKMRNSFAQFDSVLNVVGVHMTQQARALEELTAAAGKTAWQLGALTTAGLVVGTAIESWNLGRKIAELAGTDQIIADATAKMLGWADATGERAAAQADVLARASKNAGAQIFDLTNAMIINAAAAENDKAQWAAWNAEVARLAASARQVAIDLQTDAKWAREVSAEFERQEKQLKANAEATAQWRARARELELSLNGVTAGLLGLSAEEQKRTQAGFEAFGKGAGAEEAARARLTPSLVSPDTATYMQSLKDYATEMERLVALEKIGLTVEAQRQEADAKFVAVMNALTDSPTRGAQGPAAAVQINVSGVLDPRTIRELTDAVSSELLRRTGRQLPAA